MNDDAAADRSTSRARQRVTIHALIFAALTLLGGGRALAQVSCGPGKVGALACDDREVKALVRQVGAEADRLRCTGAARRELGTVERAWGRRQYGCRTATDTRACVMGALQSEVAWFRSLSRCEIATHPVKFEAPDPSYVLAHPEVFAGSEVTVVGGLNLEDCTPGATSVVGRIREDGDASVALEIRFERMPDGQRDFLCTKRPFSSWRGTVRLTDGHVPYLYATDVLGVPLH